MMKLVFLGTGTSTGVPMPACSCATCRSTDPRNQRWRCSAYLEGKGSRVVIDTAPEFRLQCLREGIHALDAVLLTHDHADHVAGLDDIRNFTIRTNKDMPVYTNARTASLIRERFAYFWREYIGGNLPKVDLRETNGKFAVGNLEIEPLEVMHGLVPISAYLCGGLAYVTDVSAIPLATMERLRGIDTLVLDCTRITPHPTHFCLPEALEAIQEISPRVAYLTHISHYMNHAEIQESLPPGVYLAYDGLRIDIPE